eukprot:Phypoly_transcript_00013.p1 GENE.Phypoly_transcript_00013~~Phypoly_transcript_00013.p1  ORF type:complete len:3714 (+),score=596.07 Phypoly_transcript_00013:46-11187(+)
MTRNMGKPMEIAIIGAGCRFPGGVSGLDSFWNILLEGKDCISEVPSDRWSIEEYYDPTPGTVGKTYSKYGGFIDNLQNFDPMLFGITPREASSLDPQQRMLLEVSYETLEDAGLSLKDVEGTSTGVFVGIMNDDFKQAVHERVHINGYTSTGSAVTIVSNRLSYFLNVLGPSLSIDTACSSSLVAIHYACESLQRGDCKMALCGGTNYLLVPEMYIGLAQLQMLSPDGRCKAFDITGNGYVRGEGTGLVLLKPLEQALKDKDRIHAVIRGSFVNSDGRSSVPITTPNMQSHERMLRAVYTNAQVDPALIQYVEAHGTGTLRGDPVEAGAVGHIIGSGSGRKDTCVIGSVKTNIGHTESASGVAGLIKACLMFKHHTIPPNLHFKTPNPDIDFEALKLRVPVKPEEFPPRKGDSYFIGVNSFGYGGTNAHIILEEPPLLQRTSGRAKIADSPHTLLLSAHNKPTLEALAKSFIQFLKDKSSEELHDICYTTAARRSHHVHRLAVVGGSVQTLSAKLDGFLSSSTKAQFVYDKADIRSPPPVVFVFSGQGPQWWGMGRDLLHHKVFRASFDQVDKILQQLTGWSVLERLQKSKDEPAILDDTSISQPSMFAIQVSLVDLWRHWGVTPAAVVGHSIGEIAAAYASGAITLQQGVQIVFNRSSLQKRLANSGKMLAVNLSMQDTQDFLSAHGAPETRVCIAAVNSPTACTLAGDAQELEAIHNKLDEAGTFNRVLRVNIAFHSPYTEPIKKDFLHLQIQASVDTPQVPFFSSVTGKAIEGKIYPQYWWNNIREAVLFNQAASQLIYHFLELDQSNAPSKYIFLEIGPHPVLATYTKEIIGSFANFPGVVLPSLKRDANEFDTILTSLAQLHAFGVVVDWNAFESVLNPTGSLVSLPLYPWQRQRYWILDNEKPSSSNSKSNKISAKLSAGGIVPTSFSSGDDNTKFMWNMSVGLDNTPPESSNLTTVALPYIADHNVHGSILMPGVGFVELVRQAFSILLTQVENPPDKSVGIVVQNVRLSRALVLEEESASLLNINISVSSPLDWNFTVSNPADSNPYVTGSLNLRVSLMSTTLKPAAREAFIAGSSAAISSEEVYASLSKCGLVYGPNFSLVRQLWQSAGRAMAEIVVPQNLRDSFPQYGIHPALFDSCLHALCALVDVDSKGGFIPVKMVSIYFYSKPNPQKSTYYALVSLTQNMGAEAEGDVALYDEDGEPIMEMYGFRVRFLYHREERPVRECVYTTEWQKTPIPDEVLSQASVNPDCEWIIFDDDDFGAHVINKLRKTSNVAQITPGSSFQDHGHNKFTINPEEASQYHEAIAPFLETDKPVVIVYLWPVLVPSLVNDTSLEEIRRSQIFSFGGPTYLSQALWKARKSGQRTIVWIVTKGARDVSGKTLENSKNESENPLQASANGVGRVIGLESDGLFDVFLFDLDPRENGSKYTQLWNELVYSSVGDEKSPLDNEIANRDGARLANRIRREEVHISNDERSHSLLLKDIVYPPADFGFWALDQIEINNEWQWIFKQIPAFDVEDPKGNVVVKIEACGIINQDIMISNRQIAREISDFVGIEAAGVVDSVPAGSKNLKPGDEVLGIFSGSLASHARGSELSLVKKPKTWSFEEAAAVPLAFSSVYYSLKYVANLQPGQLLLVHFAGDGIGVAAIWYAKRVGAEIFVTADSKKEADFLSSLGAKHVLHGDFIDEIAKMTHGLGVHVVLHSGPRALAQSSMDLVRDGGHFIDLGKTHALEKLQTKPVTTRLNVSHSIVELRHLYFHSPVLFHRVLSEVVELLEGVNLKEVLPISLVSYRNVALAFKQFDTQQQNIDNKIVVKMTPNPDYAPPTFFQAGASYLIAGGVQGFGLATAEWMSRRGAKHLVLFSRSGAKSLDDYSKSVISEIETRSKVYIKSADISSKDQVEALIKDIDANLPPLRGIVQCAAAMEDCLAIHNNMEKYHRVANPKIIGTWNLHHSTLHIPLDFFLMYSSISSFIGNTAQSSYAAANLFMDEFASYRRARNLPATTINWGNISGVGMFSRNEGMLRDLLAQKGVYALAPSETFCGLQHIIFADDIPAQISVVRVDLSIWVDFHQGYINRLRYKAVADEDRVRRESAQTFDLTQGSQNTSAAQVFFQSLEGLPAAQKLTHITQHISLALAKVLQVEVADIMPNERLSSYGIDSLMSYTFRNVLLNELQLDVPIVYLLQRASVGSLADKLLTQINNKGTTEEKPKPTPKKDLPRIKENGKNGVSKKEPDASASKVIEELQASMLQESLYFLELAHPQGGENLISYAIILEGSANKGHFEAAFGAMVRRHAQAFSSHFVLLDDKLHLRVTNEPFAFTEFHDWSSYPDKDERVKNFFNKQTKTGFNVNSTSPLSRNFLLRTSPTTHIVLSVSHHLVVDGWCAQVALRDFAVAFKQVYNNSTISLPPARSYTEFVQWQQDNFEKNSPLRVKMAEFWKSQLKGVQPVTIGDFPRPPVMSYKAASVPLSFPPSLVLALNKMRKQARTTLFSVIMATFQAILHLYSGQDDIAVGTGCANRTESKWEDIVGLFANAIVVRTPSMKALKHFPALLDHVSNTIAHGLEHQEFPFNLTVSELNPLRDPRHHPLFQYNLTVHTEQLRSADLNIPLSVAVFPQWEFVSDNSLYDLDLRLWGDGEGMRGYAVYSTDIFREGTILRMMDNLVALLKSVTEDWQRDLSEMAWLSQSELKKMKELNNSEAEFPRVCTHKVLEDIALYHAKSPALEWVAKKVTWSYDQLNRTANAIASHVISRGVTYGARVGLIFEKSPFAIASMIAAWKAGATYVPINTEAPQSQFLYVLSDSGAQTVLVHSSTEAKVRAILSGTQIQIINVEKISVDLTGPSVNPSVPVTTTDLAYIFYTSGTTGKPKGVCLEHLGVTNLLHDVVTRSWGLNDNDRMLQLNRYYFDMSVSEIFAPLFCGATLVIAEQDDLLPGPQFVELLKNLEITTLTILPSALSVLDLKLKNESLPKLRLVMPSGESLLYETTRNWVTPSRSVVNSYGPTEITVESNFWRVTHENLPRISEANVPIGPPRNNTYVFILHPETLQPVPLGGLGEIIIGGIGVARGYTDAKLTAQKFLSPIDVLCEDILRTLPAKEVSQGRLYRTGDIGRWLVDDGAVHCVGRMDSQVKLRGYRIELDGISAALYQHPSVANAAVVLHSPIPSDPSANQLVAFVDLIPGSDATSAPTVLRAHIADVLPVYMHPSNYIIGPLPRGASGKIDKKALVVPDLANNPRSSSVVVPLNPDETDLLHIFLDVLRVPKEKSGQVGVTANFFELGGNSLHAARLLMRINARFGVALPVRTLFSGPTVRSLALSLGLVAQSTPKAPISHPPPPSPATEKVPPSSVPTSLNSYPASLPSPPSSYPHSIHTPQISHPDPKPLPTTTKTPLMLLREGEKGKPAVFCVHPAGGSALAFFPLSQELQGFHVYGLEDTNESGEEGLYSYASIDDMAQDYVNAIQTVQPHGPYYLLGFSMGGVISYTMAALLERKGEKIAIVMVLDAPVRAETEEAHEIAELQATEVLLALVHGAFSKFTQEHDFSIPSTENGNGHHHPNGSTNGLGNGKAHGRENGNGSLKENGHTNGHGNGYAHEKSTTETLEERWTTIHAIASQDPTYARFVSVFRTHLALLRSHTLPPSLTYSGPVLLLLCSRNATTFATGWRAVCEDRVEVVSLPPGFSHLQVLLHPCVEYVASVLSSRLKLLHI